MSGGNFLRPPYVHIWVYLIMGPGAIGSKFKLCQIWPYYITFKLKFNHEQLLLEHFTVKINHSPVISQKVRVIDVI